MATKLGRKQLPSGYNPSDFTYQGRPAKDQGDFGNDVGVADCACVNQLGEANNAKYYHGGVVQAGDGSWWVYLEWGRMKGAGTSWNGSFRGGDFQFVQCSSESEARAFFAKQMASKNTKRLVQKTIAGTTIWTAKASNGYLVQALATRERGLPDAYKIKDDSGIQAKPKAAPAKPKAKAAAAPTRTFQPQVIALAQSLVGGTATYTRSLSQATGVTPTMEAILLVRDQLIPAALARIKVAGSDVSAQIRDRDLRDISRTVYSMVPRYIPRTGLSDEEAILSADNVLQLQNDLDAFEAALSNEDFTVEDTSSQPAVDPVKLLGAEIAWIDPRSDHGKWLAKTFQGMSNNRHGYMGRGDARITNMFSVSRPKQDRAFRAAVSALAAKRRGQKYGHVAAGLQPRNRSDLTDISDVARDANVFIGIHGTRPVNVAPILQGNLRLPKSLKGVHITGAAFGHGIYYATDWRKSYGYTGHGRAYYGGGGQIRGRGFFMFLCDVAGGKFHYPTRAWGINGATCPGGGDSVYAHPSKIGSLANDEHVIFNADHQRIRYIIEGSL
jgi:hypothetical protein